MCLCAVIMAAMRFCASVFKDYAVKPNVAFIATTAESALTFGDKRTGSCGCCGVGW